MTNWNIAGTQWVAQIRKLMGDAENSNLYIISQRLERIDVAWRDLLQVIIQCVNMGKDPYGNTLIMQYHFVSDLATSATKKYELFLTGDRRYYKKAISKRVIFRANPYFDLYDTYEIFKDNIYL